MADLTTTAKVKAVLGRTDTTDDTLIASLVTRASEWIENYCDRKFGTASYTEYLTGANGEVITPKHWPITAITSVNYDTGRDWLDGTAIDSTDIYISPNATGIICSGYSFDQFAVGAIKVVYVAGYATIPGDLEHAANVLTCQLLKQAKAERFGIEGQALPAAAGGGSLNFIIDLPADVRAILEKRKRTAL